MEICLTVGAVIFEKGADFTKRGEADERYLLAYYVLNRQNFLLAAIVQLPFSANTADNYGGSRSEP